MRAKAAVSLTLAGTSALRPIADVSLSTLVRQEQAFYDREIHRGFETYLVKSGAILGALGGIR